METNHSYTDLLLTVAVVHFVMSKLIWIDKKEDGNGSWKVLNIITTSKDQFIWETLDIYGKIETDWRSAEN